MSAATASSHLLWLDRHSRRRWHRRWHRCRHRRCGRRFGADQLELKTIERRVRFHKVAGGWTVSLWRLTDVYRVESWASSLWPPTRSWTTSEILSAKIRQTETWWCHFSLVSTVQILLSWRLRDRFLYRKLLTPSTTEALCSLRSADNVLFHNLSPHVRMMRTGEGNSGNAVQHYDAIRCHSTIWYFDTI